MVSGKKNKFTKTLLKYIIFSILLMFLVILAYFSLLLEDLSKFSKSIRFLVRPQQNLS